MRRIKTTTAEADTFGSGKNGFTDGDATTAVPPTRLQADWFNHAQEEIARTVESDGAAVVVDGEDPNYYQLDDAVARSTPLYPRGIASSFVNEGLALTGSGSALEVSIATGAMVFEARRYRISGPKLQNKSGTAHEYVDIDLEFGGAPTNGNYSSTFDGAGLVSPVTVTTDRAAGVPTDNDALATQHAADILAQAGVSGPLENVVLDATAVGARVVVRIDGTLGEAIVTNSAPSPGTLEVVETSIVFEVSASSDVYFFIAPEDPATPADPPDRGTVHIEYAEVPNGNTPPATPSGTLWFGLAVTGAGSVSSVSEPNHGVALLARNGVGILVREATQAGIDTSIVPMGPSGGGNVDIGALNDDEIRAVFSSKLFMASDSGEGTANKSLISSHRATLIVSGGAQATHNLIDEAEWDDGSAFYVEVRGAAFDLIDPTDSFSFRAWCHAHLDGGSITLDGTGGVPPAERGGAGGIAAGMDAGFQIVGGVLQFEATGHSADLTRWLLKVDIVGYGAGGTAHVL